MNINIVIRFGLLINALGISIKLAHLESSAAVIAFGIVIIIVGILFNKKIGKRSEQH